MIVKPYVHDEIGNLTSVNASGSNCSTTYAYASAHVHALEKVNGITKYAYNANGSMTTRGSQALTWDEENRMTAVSGGESFVYDGDGVRVKETETPPATMRPPKLRGPHCTWEEAFA